MNIFRRFIDSFLSNSNIGETRPIGRLPQTLNGEKRVLDSTMIEAHPSHAVRLNLQHLTGITPRFYGPPDTTWHFGEDEDDDFFAPKNSRDDLKAKILPEDLYALRPVEAKDYAAFLMKRIGNGGTISHIYERSLGQEVLAAPYSMTIPCGEGSAALDVLASDGVHIVRIGGRDHGNTYNSADGSVTGFGTGWVPLYTDVARIMANQGWKPKSTHFESRAWQQFIKLVGTVPTANLADTIGVKQFGLSAGEPGDH